LASSAAVCLACLVSFSFSALIHSSFPSPGCLIVSPIFGSSPLYEIATIRAMHLSPWTRFFFPSLPVRTPESENDTKSSMVCEMWIMPRIGPIEMNAPKFVISSIVP